MLGGTVAVGAFPQTAETSYGADHRSERAKSDRAAVKLSVTWLAGASVVFAGAIVVFLLLPGRPSVSHEPEPTTPGH